MPSDTTAFLIGFTGPQQGGSCTARSSDFKCLLAPPATKLSMLKPGLAKESTLPHK